MSRSGYDELAAVRPVLAAITPADAEAVAAAWRRQHSLTKPRGSLGRLETVGARLAGIAGRCPPPVPEPVAVALFAADHGVHAQRVTPWPQQVTGQMVANLAAGGAVANAFARQLDASVRVVDVGIAFPGARSVPGVLQRRVRPGTADMTDEPAMSRTQAVAAVQVGVAVGRELVTAGNRLLVAGEMGIANTTASAALVATFCGLGAVEVTGRGTGMDDTTLARKVEVVDTALALHRPDPGDPVGVLARVGGLEHAAIAGLLLAAAASRVPVVLDGVSTNAAALVAQAMAPPAVDHWIAGHRSTEPGAAAALRHLGLSALIDLDLRLGEGSGALLAVPLVQAAARVLSEVATYESAGVSERPVGEVSTTETTEGTGSQ
ncbi:MAG TPA: nicotinate-nucleotide--dimethylbenzimidazole phosphoribosyltransferase [Nocardioidaceae bacterium]|nr:nicotinate-nucleotide--dimethylbenzimidazole phosphoribosyltransferase [Nocardioidaceae bacterium]